MLVNSWKPFAAPRINPSGESIFLLKWNHRPKASRVRRHYAQTMFQFIEHVFWEASSADNLSANQTVPVNRSTGSRRSKLLRNSCPTTSTTPSNTAEKMRRMAIGGGAIKKTRCTGSRLLALSADATVIALSSAQGSRSKDRANEIA